MMRNPVTAIRDFFKGSEAINALIADVTVDSYLIKQKGNSIEIPRKMFPKNVMTGRIYSDKELSRWEVTRKTSETVYIKCY